MLRVIEVMIACVTVCIAALVNASTASADELVTYEVVSEDIGMANIEYEDSTGRVAQEGVMLPWRVDVMVHAVRKPPPDGSQVRADWRPVAGPAKWVSVRIIYQGKLLCQNTLDVGNATCYGITPRIT
ncbi:hypothetical protein [Mycobacterium talmoniae]|uniref:Uncharacterized protein n=1 Tax=Mycobacterium talmoniae TaxID=1858794 RepID=A0A2S8BMM1_9MYCO|nr:hypothetical protein [Mycobacterium talmoniae]PQM47927.1 hypothetical protein C1Y40_01750 [Mycobacterium talmoniae]